MPKRTLEIVHTRTYRSNLPPFSRFGSHASDSRVLDLSAAPSCGAARAVRGGSGRGRVPISITDKTYRALEEHGVNVTSPGTPGFPPEAARQNALFCCLAYEAHQPRDAPATTLPG
jgi:hypothetical protein